MYDVISVGDSTLDCFLSLNQNEAELKCQINKDKCEICFDYGQKIPVESLNFSLGGNAANVAIALNRLGFGAGLYTLHGDDEAGRIIGEKIKLEGLRGEFVHQERGRSSYSTIINYQKERTILEKKEHRTYTLFKDFPATPFIYVSSLGPDYEKFFNEVSEFVTKHKMKLGFNPAQPQLRGNFKTYETLVRASHFVFMNKEEAGQMLAGTRGEGRKASEEPGGFKEMLREIAKFGPKYVLVTDGINGANCYDGEKFYHSDIFPAEAVEATGAGDAFASGFMGAVMHRLSTVEAMKWGMVNSASVVTKVGAVAGLLNREEIENRLRLNPDFGPKEV